MPHQPFKPNDAMMTINKTVLNRMMLSRRCCMGFSLSHDDKWVEDISVNM